MEHINMLGQPCPIPVIQAKKALAKPQASGVEVLVDNVVAVQNLEKMAKGLGYTFDFSKQAEDHYTVSIAMNGAPPPVAEQAPAGTKEGGAAGGLTVLVTTNQMGTGAEELGKILIKGFIFSLTELPETPEAVIFLNGGAHLTTEGANTLEDLKTLAGKGAKICTCGTCLNYYNLTEKLAVGEVVNMFTIASMLAAAGRIITL
ncbi:MAG: sulfurtransferase-like selenium metabolism protein YedF [Oscillospiraceae bacterium]